MCKENAIEIIGGEACVTGNVIYGNVAFVGFGLDIIQRFCNQLAVFHKITLLIWIQTCSCLFVISL